ncbi:hypothetical protein KY363_01440 [Candidatus Woesearchaeota archaeon]|nr:hypothetical protein [Candidatus Woesearchaeota archaeon]
MGVFDFLKKGKSDTDSGMELPPVPKMEGFPDFSMEETPPLPESSLPPLPSEMPQAIPPMPEHETIQAPRMEFPMPPSFGAEPKKSMTKQPIQQPTAPQPQMMPEFPETDMPTFPEYPQNIPTEEDLAETLPLMPKAQPSPKQKPKPTFPSMPEQAPDEIVPDRIPPLEGIPEAPDFNLEPEPKPVFEAEPEPEYPEFPEPVQPFAYVPPEEKTPRPVRHGAGPLYIRTDTIRAVLDYIEQVKSKFTSEDDIVFRMKEIKSAQDQHYESFRQTLEDMQRKLLFIDRSLFESR